MLRSKSKLAFKKSLLGKNIVLSPSTLDKPKQRSSKVVTTASKYSKGKSKSKGKARVNTPATAQSNTKSLQTNHVPLKIVAQTH